METRKCKNKSCLTTLYQVADTKGTRKITRFRRFFYRLNCREKTDRNIISLDKGIEPLIFQYFYTITPATIYMKLVMLRLDRCIQFLMDSPVKPWPTVGALSE